MGTKEAPRSVDGHDLTGIDQKAICGNLCGARCCRYVTISIDTPRAESDWDEMRWWLLHQGVMVYRDEDGDWAVCVETRCSNLTPQNLCGVWPEHPTICKDHDPTICEFRDRDWYTLLLTSEDDLAAYLEKKGLRRGRKTLESIRKARAARPGGSPAGSSGSRRGT